MENASTASSGASAVFEPITKALTGTLKVPSDKSLSHCVVLFASMAEGESRVGGILDCADVRSSIQVCQQLGAEFNLKTQKDGSLAGKIKGWGKNGPVSPDKVLNCGNSGTTARVLMGILGGAQIEATLTGDEALMRRPMGRISTPLMKMGVHFDPPDAQMLPLTIKGKKELNALDYSSPLPSSQLKSAILLAGLSAQGKTIIQEPYPTDNSTELLLPVFGATTTAASCHASVEGPQVLKPGTIKVPGDPSLAAYFMCAAAVIPGSKVVIEGVSLNYSRLGFMRVLERMGVNAHIASVGYEGKGPYGTLSVEYCPQLHGCEVSAAETPSLFDEMPALAVVASLAKGITIFRNVQDFQSKEGGRRQAIEEALCSLGVDAYSEGSDLYIEGEKGFKTKEGVTLLSHNDHRLAMAWALAGMVGGSSVRVEQLDCSKSIYPGFLADFERLQKK